MRLRTYFEKMDAVNIGMFLLCTLNSLFAISYLLSNYAQNNSIFYIGLYLCGIISFFPLALLRAAFLPWTNPAKHKEYEVKQLRKEKEKERKNYLLLFLGILWLQQKDFENID